MQREPRNAPSSTITGARLRRLEHAADPDAAREVDVRADLRARADGRPGVDHRARPDPGADVDVAGHQHDALREERAVARDAGRHDPHAERGVDRASAGSCRGTASRRPPSARPCAGGSRGGSPSSPTRSTIQPSRPFSATRSSPRSRSAIASSIGAGIELAALPEALDRLPHGSRHSTSSRIAAARAHSSSVGTSA